MVSSKAMAKSGTAAVYRKGKKGKAKKLAEKITVTSKELLAKEQEWTAMMTRAWEEFLAAVMETEKFSRHFSGEPVRKLQKEFVSLGRDQSEAFRRLKAHIGKLGGIAAIYEEAERNNVNVTADN